MNDFFSVVSGFVCSIYLIIPLGLGVFYVLYSFKEKVLSKTRLITKCVLHSIIVLFSGIFIWKISNGLVFFVSNQLDSVGDIISAFVMLNTILLLTLIIIGSMIRLIRINFSIFVTKIESDVASRKQ